MSSGVRKGEQERVESRCTDEGVIVYQYISAHDISACGSALHAAAQHTRFRKCSGSGSGRDNPNRAQIGTQTWPCYTHCLAPRVRRTRVHAAALAGHAGCMQRNAPLFARRRVRAPCPSEGKNNGYRCTDTQRTSPSMLGHRYATSAAQAPRAHQRRCVTAARWPQHRADGIARRQPTWPSRPRQHPHPTSRFWSARCS